MRPVSLFALLSLMFTSAVSAKPIAARDTTSQPAEVKMAFAKLDELNTDDGLAKSEEVEGDITCPRERYLGVVDSILVSTGQTFAWGGMLRPLNEGEMFAGKPDRPEPWIILVSDGKFILYLPYEKLTKDAADSLERPRENGGVVLNITCNSNEEEGDCLQRAINQVDWLPRVSRSTDCGRDFTEAKPKQGAPVAEVTIPPRGKG